MIGGHNSASSVMKYLRTTVKPDVFLRATLQYCDAMLQHWCGSCSVQIAIALRSGCQKVTIFKNIFANYLCQKRVLDL